MRTPWVLLLLACGGTGNNRNPDMAASDVLSTEERDAFDRGADPAVSTQELAALADSFFSFDPTIDPSQDAAGNAAIQSQISLQVGDGGAPCGTITLSGLTVTADFGAGCTLKNGVVVSGSASATVGKSGSTISIAFTFTMLTVNGKGLAGNASFATSNGTSFTVNANLTSGGSSIVAQGLTLTGAAGSITVDGMLATTRGGVTSALTFTGVVWKSGDCYPSSGTLRIKIGFLDETITFSAATASSGAVVVTIGRRNIPAKLPAYGSCPR